MTSLRFHIRFPENKIKEPIIYQIGHEFRVVTNVRRGLPPGPIANPGRAALEAAVAPARTAALYFVSRNDGSHAFSETLDEHNRAVRRFQPNRD